METRSKTMKKNTEIINDITKTHESIEFDENCLLIIESFHEIFTEPPCKIHITKLLVNINNILKKINNDNVYFSNLQKLNVKLDELKPYPELYSFIEKYTDPTDFLPIDDMIIWVKTKKSKNSYINTIYIGGVYGNACVFNSARHLATNIITIGLPPHTSY